MVNEIVPVDHDDPIGYMQEKYTEKDWNLLVPVETSTFPIEVFKVVGDRVTLSADPDDGDVYKTDDGKFTPSKTGLLKLASAAGAQVNWNAHGRTDDRSDPDVVAFATSMRLQLPNGVFQDFPATYELNIRDREDAAVSDATKAFIRKLSYNDDIYDPSDGQKRQITQDDRVWWVNERVGQRMARWRMYKVQLAETGAISRAIRGALSLKSSYSQEQMAKPFIVARLVPNLDLPDVRAAYIEQVMKTGLFGGQHIEAKDSVASPRIIEVPAASLPVARATPVPPPAPPPPDPPPPPAERPSEPESPADTTKPTGESENDGADVYTADDFKAEVDTYRKDAPWAIDEISEKQAELIRERFKEAVGEAAVPLLIGHLWGCDVASMTKGMASATIDWIMQQKGDALKKKLAAAGETMAF